MMMVAVIGACTETAWSGAAVLAQPGGRHRPVSTPTGAGFQLPSRAARYDW